MKAAFLFFLSRSRSLTLSGPGFFACLGRGGVGGEEPAVYNSITIHGIEMKFGRVVENHKLINLVKFNFQITSSLRHNYVITVALLDSYVKSCRSKLEKFDTFLTVRNDR